MLILNAQHRSLESGAAHPKNPAFLHWWHSTPSEPPHVFVAVSRAEPRAPEQRVRAKPQRLEAFSRARGGVPNA